MDKLRGFIEYDRVTEENVPVHSRVKNYKEFTVKPLDTELEKQGSRCMDCGVPFCHSGCPLGNMIPDFNLENHIGDYDSTLSDTYKDLLELRKNLIQNSQVTIDVASNLSSVENFIDSIDVNTFDSLTPANTQMDFSYDVMNDVLYRNKLKNK